MFAIIFSYNLVKLKKMHLANCKDFCPIETMSPAADYDNKPSQKKYLCTIKRKKIKRSFAHKIAL